MARQQAEILGVVDFPTKQEVEEIRNQEEEQIITVNDEPEIKVEATKVDPVPHLLMLI